MEVKLSVIIPTKDRQDILKNLLSSFISQEISYPIEFIIIDQTEISMLEKELYLLIEIAAYVAEKSFVKYYHFPDLSGLTQARNIGIEKASGRYVLFLDDDIILLPGFIKGVMEGFKWGFNGVSGVLFENTADEGWMKELYTNLFFRGYLKDKRRRVYRKFHKYELYTKTNVLSGGLAAYTKELLANSKFDENLIRYALGEDKEYSMRVSYQGAKLAICTHAIAYHMKHPVGKPNLFNRYEGKTALIKYLQYRFSGLMKRRLIISTIWALIGTIIDAFINSIIKKTAEPVKGAISGLKKASRKFENLEFIKKIEQSQFSKSGLS